MNGAVDTANNDGRQGPSYRLGDYQYLVAISYARREQKGVGDCWEGEEIAARLDRGLVELLGGAADRVFFDVRSLERRLSPAHVLDELSRVYGSAFMVVQLWSPAYDLSRYTFEECAAAAGVGQGQRGRDPNRRYVIRLAPGEPAHALTFDADLTVSGAPPLGKIAVDIVDRLESAFYHDDDAFARNFRKARGFIKWDPPVYRCAPPTDEMCVCNDFGCHHALTASCEAGDMHALATRLSASFAKVAMMAQNFAAARPTEGLPWREDPTAAAELTAACVELLDVFSARCEHLDRMARVRGADNRVRFLDIARSRDSPKHQAQRMVDFLVEQKSSLRPHIAILAASLLLFANPPTDDFAGVDPAGAPNANREKEEERRAAHAARRIDAANKILLVCKLVSDLMHDLSQRRDHLPHLHLYSADVNPKAAATAYADATARAFWPLV